MPDINKELGQLVEEFRAETKSSRAETAESKEKLEKIETRILDIEGKNQELVAKLAESKKAEEDLQKEYKNLERALYMSPNCKTKSEKSHEMKSFEKFIVSGKTNITAEEQKYLRTDVNTDGGYLAPGEYVNEIIKKITEIDPMRSVARVRTTSSPKMEIPTRTGLVTTNYAGEGATSASSNSTYGKENLKLHRLTGITEITLAELNMAAFDMSGEITQDIAESAAQKEGEKFFNGSGVDEPEGLMTVSGIEESNSGAATELTANGFIEMIGVPKTGYDLMWAMNRRTFSKFLTLEDGAGHYLWTVGNIAAGVPNMIIGMTYILANSMADVAADAFPVVLGDFRRGYMIGDHTNMSFIRDDYTLAGDGKVRFIIHRWNGGQVVLKEAFVKMKVAA